MKKGVNELMIDKLSMSILRYQWIVKDKGSLFYFVFLCVFFILF